MKVLVDYAPYYEQKEAIKEDLTRMKLSFERCLMWFSFIFVFAVIFIK